MTVPVRWPQVRWFPQCSAFQPQPVVNGQPLLGAPAYHDQDEAALFVLEAFRQLGLPRPFTAEELRPLLLPADFEVPSLALLPGLTDAQREARETARKKVGRDVSVFLTCKGLLKPGGAPAVPEPPQPAKAKEPRHPQQAK